MSQEHDTIQDTEKIERVEPVEPIAPYPKVSFLLEVPYPLIREIVDQAPLRLDDSLHIVEHRVLIEVVPRDLESFRRLSVWASALLAGNKIYSVRNTKMHRGLLV